MRCHLASNFSGPQNNAMRTRLAGNGDMQIRLADSAIVDRRPRAGHRHRLISYFYLRQQAKATAALLKAANGDNRDLIVDSGLYSFMFGSEQGKLPSTYEAYRDYTRKYLDDMAGWGSDCTLVEADTHRLLGMDATERLREEFKPLGSRVMYVWHQPEGLDGLIKLARERDYIALSLPEIRMIAAANKKSGDPNAMCNDLLRRVHAGCNGQPPRIHLLGCTQQELMETRYAYSCDSTSWLSGIRYGQGCTWSHKKGLGRVSISSPQFLAFRAEAELAHPESAALARSQTNADYYLNVLGCAYAYVLYQAWLDSHYTPIPCRGDALPEGPVR